jgi:hypothetical protein
VWRILERRHTSATCLHAQDDTLLAYQICFDLFENESQSFMAQVRCPAMLLPSLPS